MIDGKWLIANGWPEGRVIGLALQAAKQESLYTVAHVALDVLANPTQYLEDHAWAETAREVKRLQAPPAPSPLLDSAGKYSVWGPDLIDENTHEQMAMSMRLPVTIAGALMPDAHLGYGLPVGGVLATHDAVIPYAVGVDIACRMRLTVTDIDAGTIEKHHDFMVDSLIKSTNFGTGGKFKPGRRSDHPILADPRWDATPFLKSLQDLAECQLGTSGSGNHFVEWGIYEDCAGPRLAILSHSGSRGPGFKICNKYAKIAKQEHPELPREAKELAWLPLDHDMGREYMLAMGLAGDFAAANHEVIHRKMLDFLEVANVDMVIDHHHNYAWIEQYQGSDVVVHRKGATPAARGELGVIPGDSLRAGWVVIGRGVEASINSASHGAGRLMSRTKAKQQLNKEENQQLIEDAGVTLIGGGLDEAPLAYKNIDEVLDRQTDLVHRVGQFTPKIVRMDKGESALANRRE